MRQLTALDAQFLGVESATTAAHVAGVAILDPASAPSGTVTRQCLINLLRERIHLAPPLRMRLAGLPFGLDRPYWVDDPDIDLDHHVREATLPAPGDERQLAAHVARIHARRLDRTRPLWEMHLIHGLADGRVALYAKVHHCAIDGVSGSEILTSLFDPSPEPRLVEATPEIAPERGPGLLPMLAGAVTRSVAQPVQTLRSMARAAVDLDAIPVVSALPGARLVAGLTRRMGGDSRPLPALPSITAPRTPFNGPVSGERVFSFGSIPMSEVKSVARAFGMSRNDVVMTLCSSALRRWLTDHDALPGRPLVAAVPVAVRTAGGGGGIGNQISAMITPMATDVVCPRERLTVVRSTMAAAKRRFAVSRRTWMSDVCAMFPSAFSALATPALFRLAGLAGAGVNLIVSNVPGPPVPLYMCGARMLSYHPMSVVTDLTGGISITCVSYDGRLDFGIVACPSRVPDVWSVIGHLHESMEELTALVEDEEESADAPVKVPA
ncbi:wax ester/triacylglycerol synthase family O-acyltransferase [Planotetraspora sp. A-T 1434]|uniref:WS/DGAT/MGAT family O-acyltransferase n=1 Tax=Planotetraspora sp. A-T 1434 TaxID=2979219 RepID=UPI0021BED677|nr:wax ester/triacylglycerol synthase family O-acyltransferase [Planotetraspora sp. A-T 1434]MCT9929307.1 wax ester/triacylglycerol synthase family O-acyltransferase [Planotetraspora sp. A-T 1434]